MSRKPVFIDVVPRDQRTAQRLARREGITSRHDAVEDEDIRDALLESIRQQQREQLNTHAASPMSRSHHASPHASSSSMSSVLPADSAPFAPSSRIRHTPASNESSVPSILASLQQMRRSPSSDPPAARDVVALGEYSQDDNKGDDDDVFASDHDRRLPMRAATSSAVNNRTTLAQRLNQVHPSAPPSASADASMYSTLFDRPSMLSSSPTPGGPRSEQHTHTHAIERELEEMRRQLSLLQQSHKDKDDIINHLVKTQQDERQRRLEMQQVLRADARALINSATHASHTHVPVVKTEYNDPASLPSRTVHSPISLAFPSLSPNASPSLMMTNTRDVKSVNKTDKVKDDEHTQDEHKYYTYDEKKTPRRIGDLPDTADEDEIDTSTDEAEIRGRDAQPDPTVKMQEPVSDNHIDSYPEWAQRREQLYPYARYPHLYSKRHSMLSPTDRKNEWMRFGILTHFNAKLFGLVARHWFESCMQELGDPLIGASTRTRRSVAKQQLNIPEMWYDPRDDYTDEQVDPDEQDLQENSYTFEMLPVPLRNMPGAHEKADTHQRELAQLVKSYVYQRKLKKVALQPATPDNKIVTQDMKDEEHPCARCKVPVYSVLKHMCTACEDAVKLAKQVAIDTGYRPVLEADNQVTQQQQTIDNNMVAPVNTHTATSIKQEKPFTLTIGTYADPSAAVTTDAAPAVKVKKEVVPLTYREQEEELQILHHRTADTVRASTCTEDDEEEERLSPMGDVLSVVFLPSQRVLQRRLRRTELGNFRERASAVTSVVTTIGKYDGTLSEAPMYLKQLCSLSQQFGLNEGEIVQVMQRTLTGNALMWLNSNMHACFNLPYKPLQALLHRFRTQYIGAHITRDLRKQMATTVLTNDNLTMKDLDTHYAAYQGLLMRLQMSDKHVDEEETRMEFFTSLPRSVRTFIGSNVDKCTTVHDVYVQAQKSVMLNASRAGAKQDGDLPRVVGNLNALPALPTGNKPSSRHAPKAAFKPPVARSADKNKREAMCYHCGDRGHYTGDCPYGKGEQTLKGQQLWAKRNRDNGWTYGYDQQWWIAKSQEIAARSAAQNDKQHKPRKQKVPSGKPDAINVDDESAPIDVDEE
jgi:hypothetical protein